MRCCESPRSYLAAKNLRADSSIVLVNLPSLSRRARREKLHQDLRFRSISAAASRPRGRGLFLVKVSVKPLMLIACGYDQSIEMQFAAGECRSSQQRVVANRAVLNDDLSASSVLDGSLLYSAEARSDRGAVDQRQADVSVILSRRRPRLRRETNELYRIRRARVTSISGSPR